MALCESHEGWKDRGMDEQVNPTRKLHKRGDGHGALEAQAEDSSTRTEGKSPG